jgi:hypothetical protein
MKSILKDPNLQELFERDGFITLNNLLSEQTADFFKKEIDIGLKDTLSYSDVGVGSVVQDGMKFTNLANVEIQKKIQNDILHYLKEPLFEYFTQEYIFSVILATKKSHSYGGGGHVGAHIHGYNCSNDDTPAVSLFVPMQDMDNIMGLVGFVKASYKLWDGAITTGYEGNVLSINPHLQSLIDDYISFQKLKVGQAVLFHSQTIHIGLPVCSTSEKDRYALTLDLFPKNQKFIFYEMKSNPEGKYTCFGKEVLDLPYFYDEKIAPKNKMGAEIHTIEAYEPLKISEEKFIQTCRK